MNDVVRPTRAVAHALIGGVLLSGLGIVLSQPLVVALGVPLLLYAVLATAATPRGRVDVVVTQRTQDGEHPGSVTLEVATQPQLGAGASLAISAPSAAGVSVAADLPPVLVGDQPLQVSALVWRWGRVPVGDVVWMVTDAFAGWRAHGKTAGPVVTSRPPARQVRGASLVRYPTGTVGRHPSPRVGPGTESVGVRPFADRDTLQRVHWKATARTGSLHVIITQADRDASILVVLDTRIVVGADHMADTVDLACEAASALTHHYATLGDRTALVDLGGRCPTIPFGTGVRQGRRVLEALSGIDRTGPAAATPTLPRVVPGTQVFLLSPLLDLDTIAVVVRLVAAGCSVACMDVLPAALPCDRETPEVLALRLRAAERHPTIAALRHLGVPVMDWESPQSLAPLLRLVGTRPRVGR